MTILLILGALFALLLLGVPVAFALGGMGRAMLYLGGFSPLMAPQSILSTLDGFILLAVPLFYLGLHPLNGVIALLAVASYNALGNFAAFSNCTSILQKKANSS